ncbi:MAG: hypothetical protein ACFNZW_05145 [Coriobacteriaceae bacterium]
MPKGKPHPAELKARVTIEVMHAKKTANELTFEHDLNPNLVKNWLAKATFEIHITDVGVGVESRTGSQRLPLR